MPTKTLRITVTQHDIDHGVARNPDHCPIARAASAFAKQYVEVDTCGLVIDGVTYALPPEATEFIWAYDDGDDVDPFTFDAIRRA